MRQFTRRTALTGGAAGIAAMALEACGGSKGVSSSKAATKDGGGAGPFGSGGSHHFVMVNDVRRTRSSPRRIYGMPGRLRT